MTHNEVQETVQPLSRIRSKADEMWAELKKQLAEDYEHVRFSDEQKQHILEMTMKYLEQGIEEHLK